MKSLRRSERTWEKETESLDHGFLCDTSMGVALRRSGHPWVPQVVGFSVRPLLRRAFVANTLLRPSGLGSGASVSLEAREARVRFTVGVSDAISGPRIPRVGRGKDIS